TFIGAASYTEFYPLSFTYHSASLILSPPTFVTSRHPHSFPTRRSSDLRSSWPNRSATPPHHAADRLRGVYRARARLLRRYRRERSEEHTSELQSRFDLVCRLLLEKKKRTTKNHPPLT